MSGLRLAVRLGGVVVLVAALVPCSATAFSFLPGGFGPGEYIDSISISAAGGGFEYDSGTLASDFGDDTVSASFSVSEVKMTDGTSYSVPLGDVMLSMVLGVDVVTLNPFDSFSATLTKEMMVDLMIVDLADGGNVLLEADFTSAEFNVSQKFGGVISGSLSGSLEVVGGDPGFAGVFGSPGNLGPITLTELNGGTVTDVCGDLTGPLGYCLPGSDWILDFTANPNGTLNATPIPEPATLTALGLGLLALAARKRT